MTAAEHKSAAGALAFAHPRAAFPPEPVIHVGQENFAQLALGDQPFLHLAERIETQHHAHHGFGVIFRQRRGQTVQLYFGNGRRFFQKDLFARFGGEDSFFRMQIVRRADRNDIDPAVIEQVFETRIDCNAVESEFGNFRLDAFTAAAAESDQFAIGIFEISVDMAAGDPAAAP